LRPLVERAAELVGARDVQAAVRAVDVLQAVIWSALREELSYPEPDQVSELAERLALVIELVRAAALGPAVERRERVAEPPSSAELAQAPEPADVPEPPLAPEPPHGDEPAARGGASEARLDLPHLADPQPIQARTAESGALWLSALEDEVSRASGAGTQLALLLAELDDADRVLAAEGDRQAGATFGRFAQAVRGAVRRHDILACETDTRAWIIARDTGREGAQALGSRIANAVSDTGPWRGAPLRVSVGLAVLGEDGKDSAQLVEVAEESMYAAASSGIGVLRSAPPPSRGESA
jgi:GGDEF domain-containing protein